MTARRSCSIVMFLVLALLTACGSPQAAPPTSEPGGAPSEPTQADTADSQTPGAEQQEPAGALPADAAEKQVLRGAIGALDSDPSPLRGGGYMANWLSFWWSPLMYFDKSGELQPAIAESWEANDDFTEWTFQLDPDAVWSDGSPVTAADVKGTWELSARPETKHQRVGNFISGVVGYDAVAAGDAMKMEGLAVADERTLKVTLSEPDPAFHFRAASSLIAPVKIEQARGEDGLEKAHWYLPENKPAVSGPFMPVKFDLSEGEYIFEPNPNWWGESAPLLKRVEVRAIPNTTTIASMFKSGQLDAALALLPAHMLQEFPALFEGNLAPGQLQFFLAASRKPTEDIHVRKALIHAVDSKAVWKAAFPTGEHVPQDQALNPAASCYDESVKRYKYDPELAREELAKSSYGSAENLPKIYIIGLVNETHQRAAEAIAEFWRQNLGITQVELKPQFDDAVGPENVQVFRDNSTARFPDGAVLLWQTAHSESSIAQSKMFGYKNEEVDRLLDAALTKSPDDPERCRLAQEAQKAFLDDYMFIPWFYYEESRKAMGYVANWYRNADWQIVDPQQVYIKQH